MLYKQVIWPDNSFLNLSWQHLIQRGKIHNASLGGSKMLLIRWNFSGDISKHLWQDWPDIMTYVDSHQPAQIYITKFISGQKEVCMNTVMGICVMDGWWMAESRPKMNVCSLGTDMLCHTENVHQQGYPAQWYRVSVVSWLHDEIVLYYSHKRTASGLSFLAGSK
jgi:hypothetical protein